MTAPMSTPSPQTIGSDAVRAVGPRSDSRRERSLPRPALGLRALAALLVAAACGREEILHDLDERQASEVVVALGDAGVLAQKSRSVGPEGGSFTVEVSRADAPRALRIVLERDLPRPRPPGFGEVFSKGGLVPTAIEERALYQHALSGELARSVEAIDGVVGARVHLALGEPDPLHPGERPPPRAAVLIRCRRPACASLRALEPGIQSLVAGAADRLEPGAVSVVISEAHEADQPAKPPRKLWPVAASALATLAALGALVALGFWIWSKPAPPGAALVRTSPEEPR